MKRTYRTTSAIMLSSVLMMSSMTPAINVLAEPGITIDGQKTDWTGVSPLSTSPTAGWQGYDIGNLFIQNDASNLYFYLDAVNVPNWGDYGQWINIALQVNDQDSGVANNPLGYPFNFSQTDKKPQFHIMMRVSNDQQIKEAALYSANDLKTPIASLDQLNGSAFALDRTKGFEGKIPLSLLGLKNNDTIRALTVLSGNNAGEHGAFDVSPSATNNKIADSWNVSANPSTQSVYSDTFSVTGAETISQLKLLSQSPESGSTNVDIAKPITWTFNEPVSLDESQVQLKNKNGDDVAYKVDVAGSSVTLTPSEPLQLKTDYVATIASGAVRGLVSNTAIDAIETSFRTAEKAFDPWDTQRYIEFTYVRADKNYTDWNLWTWSTGVKDGQIDPYAITEEGAVFRIPVSTSTASIGFVIRKGTDWAVKDEFGSDRYIQLDADDRITKVTVTSGVGEFHQVPSINGPTLDAGKATFFYRDQELYEDNAMDEVESVELRINGQTYPMTYEPKNEWFTHDVQLPEGDFPYTFLVTKDGVTTEVTDPYFASSSISYRIPDITLQATIKPGKVSADENAVVKVDTIVPEGATIREMYIDARSIGGPEKLTIDPALNEQTITVSEQAQPGLKMLPITAIDNYGNRHESSAQIIVTPETMKEKDFDWDEARIYFMLTDRFKDGDPSNNNPNGEFYDPKHPESYHGGDFAGITEKMDYLKDLGINTIWITPIVDNIDWDLRYGKDGSQYGYHGYWAKNFEKLDEHLGDINAFKTLINTAHDHGIKIMVDVVLNHPGYGVEPNAVNPGASNFPTNEDRDRFAGMIRENPVNGDDVKMSLAGLPDFKTEDAAVREQLIKWQTDWLKRAKTERGDTIDFFRVDTVKHVDKTTWRAFKNELTSIKPDFKMIGEHYGASVNNTGGYLNSGQMDSLLDFDFKHQARNFVNGDIEAVENALQYRNAQLSDGATLGQFLSSHDEDGFLIAHANGDEGKHKVAASLQITSKGQPVVYYGEEIGLSGRHAGNMDQGQFNENRYDFDWSRVKGEGKDMHQHYKKLLNIRANYSLAFSKGTREVLAGGNANGYSIFKRAYGKQSVIVGLNTREYAQAATFQTSYPYKTVLTDHYSGRTYVVDRKGNVTVQLPAQDNGGTVILTK